jgi:hypothetical protein
MSRAGYAILDEPQPGGLAKYAVNPFWPLMAMMMTGTWLAGPWFIFNAFAIGSATRKSETWLIIGSVLSTAAFIALIAALAAAAPMPSGAAPYLRIVLAVIKLSFAYLVFMRQERSLALYEYYGGQVRSGALVLVAGFFARVYFVDAPGWVRFLFAI